MKSSILFTMTLVTIAVASCTTNTSGNATGPLSDSSTNDMVKPDTSTMNSTDNQSMSSPEMNNYGDTLLKK